MNVLAENPSRAFIALAVAFLISTTAWRWRALSSDGACAATLVGGLLVAAAGWWIGAALVLFFVTSTSLGHLSRHQETAIPQQKGHRRDAVQVLANGGIPLMLAATGWITGADAWTLGAGAAIAAATADTWATEIGRLSRWTPRSIVTLRALPIGTSGAVSVHGIIASAAGATLIAAFIVVGETKDWIGLPGSSGFLVASIAIAGFAGSLLDSLLGASVQERRQCERCGALTEARRHACGGETEVTGGIRGFDNDVVNGVATAAVALLAVSLAYAAS